MPSSFIVFSSCPPPFPACIKPIFAPTRGQVRSELPLKSGITCILVETLTAIDGGERMRQELVATSVKTGGPKAKAAASSELGSVTTVRFYGKADATAFDALVEEDGDDGEEE